MIDDASHQIVRLLVDWGDGDEGALGDVLPLVYDQVRLYHPRRKIIHIYNL